MQRECLREAIKDSPFFIDRPVLDTALGGTNDVTLLSASELNGFTTIAWGRSLNTSDIGHDRKIDPFVAINFIYAFQQFVVICSRLLYCPHSLLSSSPIAGPLGAQ